MNTLKQLAWLRAVAAAINLPFDCETGRLIRIAHGASQRGRTDIAAVSATAAVDEICEGLLEEPPPEYRGIVAVFDWQDSRLIEN